MRKGGSEGVRERESGGATRWNLLGVDEGGVPEARGWGRLLLVKTNLTPHRALWEKSGYRQRADDTGSGCSPELVDTNNNVDNIGNGCGLVFVNTKE